MPIAYEECLIAGFGNPAGMGVMWVARFEDDAARVVTITPGDASPAVWDAHNKKVVLSLPEYPTEHEAAAFELGLKVMHFLRHGKTDDFAKIMDNYRP